MRREPAQLAITCLLGLSIAACGGGGGGGGSTPVVNASLGGIWRGKDPIAGIDAIGVVTESGEARFIRVDGFQVIGGAAVSGRNVSGSYTGLLPYGYTFPDGSNYGNGTFSGTVQERQSITATFRFTTSAGNSQSGTGTFTYDALYDRDSSLTTIAGNYRDTDTGAVINVNSDGVVFAQDAVTGCVINGQVSMIDSRYNVYRVQYRFSSCIGSESYLNGTTATGLGVLDNTTNPERAVIGVSNAAARYALTAQYPRI